MSLSKLQKLIGYQFQDSDLLVQALTHRSHGALNNERLEFLGDSILNLAVTRFLYDRFSDATEGHMSRLRAKMVRRDTLADVAREFALGDFLIMGRGELKSGGFTRDSILSDAVEAIIGAIYLDGGLEIAQERVLVWYESRLGELSLSESEKDPKSRLQEHLQGIGASLPQYEVIQTLGLSHDQLFTVECRSESLEETVSGEGTSRRMAEQAAAQAALVALELEPG
ncbi:MAG TPA: ribonuclease III [Gammaproteobacteria bacterium]|nr:ribonuclease III [Gammaproteobacteria bacterium]